MGSDIYSETGPIHMVEEDDSELLPAEKWWRDQYGLLLAHGYRLRPRYRPGWVGPWKNTGKRRNDFEDGIYTFAENVMDANRISDGSVVSIKRVCADSQEISLALYLSSETEGLHPAMNHCVPVLDHFTDPALPQYSFLVMPLLRWFDDPRFLFVDEVLDFIQQTLEGLVYMHKRSVAHRDLAENNILQDATPLYPRGFHPVSRYMDPSGMRIAPKRRRRDVKGLKYYFIDFGISTRFDESEKPENRFVTGIDCQDREVPELSSLVPYNPFAVDIFTLGNVYQKKFLDVYENVSFLSSLIESMTARDPRGRPSSEEALAQYQDTIAKQKGFRVRWALKRRDAGPILLIRLNVQSLLHESVCISKKLMSKLS